jgi:hypothetical protein
MYAKNTEYKKLFQEERIAGVTMCAFWFQFSNGRNCDAKISVASVTNFQPPRMT